MTASTRPKPPDETVTLEFPANGRDEMNLAEFPISLLADRGPKGTKTLIFRDGNGTLTVTGSDAFGLPTALDADVIVALIQLTKQKNNFLHPTINFTRYELLRLLGWPNEGKSYRRIDESLNRWVGVSLHYNGCWWDNRSRQYGDANIHIIESVIILDGKTRLSGDDQQALPLSSFTWNKVFMESFQADNLKRLDVETYFSLEHPSSKRLYRFLDKRFYRRAEWIFDLKDIAFERVGLSRNYGHNVGKIKEKLQPAIDELERCGFLQPMTREERYFKKDSDWKIRLHAKRHATLPASPEPAPETKRLTDALTQRGVTPATATELAGSTRRRVIERQLEIFDWLSQRKDRRIAKSPAGFLVKSIEQGFAAPKGFVPYADQQKAAEARQAKEQAESETRRRKQQHAATERRQREAVVAFRNAQSPENMARIEAEAIAGATPELRTSLDDPALRRYRKTLLGQITDEFIRQRLAEPQD